MGWPGRTPNFHAFSGRRKICVRCYEVYETGKQCPKCGTREHDLVDGRCSNCGIFAGADYIETREYEYEGKIYCGKCFEEERRDNPIKEQTPNSVSEQETSALVQETSIQVQHNDKDGLRSGAAVHDSTPKVIDFGELTVVCAWCGTVTKDGKGAKISHGMCAECKANYFPKKHRKPLDCSCQLHSRHKS